MWGEEDEPKIHSKDTLVEKFTGQALELNPGSAASQLCDLGQASSMTQALFVKSGVITICS
jgi:hypothetical protein